MLKPLLTTLLAGSALLGTAIADDYNHKDWPVQSSSDGGYVFTSSGQSRAVALCTAYYAADLQGMEKHNNVAGQLGTVLREHATKMRDSFKASFAGDDADLTKMTDDMTWHFGNSAQYGVFQEFKDSANSACESYGLENNIITIEYLNGFNDKLLSAV